MRLLLATLLLLSFTGSAAAAGRICISRDTLLFGNQVTGTSVTQSSVVSNCGDGPFTFTDVSTHPATAAAFGVATSCATGQSLQPAQACSIDVTFAPVVPGQVSGGLWLHNTTTTPDQIVTFYGRGVNSQAGTATLEFAPGTLAFDPQAIGTTSPARTVSLRNLGPAPLTLRALVINGATPYDFHAPGNCVLGVPIPAGGACELYISFTPAAAGTRSARLNVDAPELASIAMMSIGGMGIAPAPATVDVVEFFNPPLNHFFLTAVREEAEAIDRGVVGPSWTRTGQSFKSYPAESTGGDAADVCRFFGTPGVGPSAHFYTADPAECALVTANAYWRYEGIAFRARLPVAGQCPAGTLAVIRFFWPGDATTASRHRYVRDPAVLAGMRAAGWVEEGAVFCAPG